MKSRINVCKRGRESAPFSFCQLNLNVLLCVIYINISMKKRIYLDHAATTYLDPRVKKAMDPFWDEKFGNASSIHKEGREARDAIEDAREKISKVINSTPEEIIFTNGGTESDNLAILGVAGKHTEKKGHIITTKIEHHAVLNTCSFLEKQGFEVTYVGVKKDGIVDVKEIEKALRDDTILVSVMYVNNEIGTVQPIKEIGKLLNNHRAIFHTDACQAAMYFDLDVKKLGVDLMTISGSKIYGPKSIGFLYVKRGVSLSPIMYGGGQERRVRPGTENVPSIVGLSEALKIAQEEKEVEGTRLAELRDYFIKRILKEIPRTYLNGHESERSPNNINVSAHAVEGEALLLYLDEYGVACSTGSACGSKDLNPSHVITALGAFKERAHGSVRFTLGKRTTKEDIDYTVEILDKVVVKLRSLSAIN